MYICTVIAENTTFMEDVYTLSDAMILKRIGDKVKSARLKQNITQKSLSEAANVSLSTLKNMEGGEIRSVDALLRILRTLGLLDALQSFVDEDQLSPREYYEMVNETRKKQRQRAAGKLNYTVNKEESEW